VSASPDTSSLTWKAISTASDIQTTIVYAVPYLWQVCRSKVTNGDFIGQGYFSPKHGATSDFLFFYVDQAVDPSLKVLSDPSRYECLAYDQGDGKNVRRPYWSSDPNDIASKKFRCGTLKVNGQDKAVYACRGLYYAENNYMIGLGYSTEGSNVCTFVDLLTQSVKNMTRHQNDMSASIEYLVYD
jgi:hypothetical protein